MPSKILHPTSSWLGRPWFIDKEQLLQLDAIIASELLKLEEKRKKMIVDSVEKEIDRSIKLYNYSAEKNEKRKQEMIDDRKDDYTFSTRCAILLKYGDQNKSAMGDSFQDIVHNPAIINEIPTGFFMKLSQKSTNFDAVISLNKDGWLKIEASTNDDDDAQRIYMRLMEWAKTIRPPIWFRLILPLASLLGLACLALSIIFSGAQFITASENASRIAHQQYVQEAHKLLDSGIANQNIPEALRILLSLDSGYRGVSTPLPHGYFYIQSPWNFVFLFLAFFLLTPPIIIGIGASERKLILWKAVLKASWSLPLWILGAIFFDPLKDYVRGYFHLFGS